MRRGWREGGTEGGRVAGRDVMCEGGRPGFSPWGEEETGRRGEVGVCTREGACVCVCVKDIQRGPTVVVSDAGVASTHPANTHQEPVTHTHTQAWP